MPKPYSGSTKRVRTSAANLMHNDASGGHSSDVPKRIKRVRPTRVKPPRPIKVCICGCNEEYQAYRDNQRYKSGHYRNRYEMHKCPDCGVMHLKGVSK